jgi:dihydrolipoamide dehydrogenase
LRTLPQKLVVVGAGYIGLELGMAFRKLGATVTVVEAQDRILPQYDAALTKPVAKALTRVGIEVRLNSKAHSYTDRALSVIGLDGASAELLADKVLVTVGRRARTAGFGLEAMAVELTNGLVKVDNRCATSMRGVWAIGDLIGEPMLAHKASAQGEMVAELIAGKRRRFEPVAIPAICFTDPEIVVVGIQPDAAGEAAQVATFPLSASGRAITMDAGGDGGFIRVVAGADQRILGFAAVGRNVSELSGEMTALIEMGALLQDVGALIHAHPTLSEGIGEASLGILGHAIHR